MGLVKDTIYRLGISLACSVWSRLVPGQSLPPTAVTQGPVWETTYWTALVGPKEVSCFETLLRALHGFRTCPRVTFLCSVEFGVIPSVSCSSRAVPFGAIFPRVIHTCQHWTRRRPYLHSCIPLERSAGLSEKLWFLLYLFSFSRQGEGVFHLIARAAKVKAKVCSIS